MQEALQPPDCPEHSADVVLPACTELDRVADDATYWAPGIGALAAVMLFFLLRRTMVRLSAQPPS
jgi:hypothetical protein